MLIKAFDRIRPEVEENLVFIGERLLNGPLVDQAHQNGRIQFMGVKNASAVRHALRHAKLMVLPSANEGLPMSVLEAMACRTPVLVTSTGELTTLIRDRKNGFLIKRRTPSVIANQMKKILARPDLRSIGAEARRTVENFDIRAVARRYEVLYRDLIR